MLDLGSGGGIDVLLSARRVGPSGFAYGVDMTEEMLELARANATRAGAVNVEFRKGQIEDLPLPDASVDVVISNCVINLSTDKPTVLAEMYRVLIPGGRIGITDVVAEDHLTHADRAAAGYMSAASPAPCPAPSTSTGLPRPGSPTHRSPSPTRQPRHALSDHPGHQARHRITLSLALATGRARGAGKDAATWSQTEGPGLADGAGELADREQPNAHGP